MMLPQKSQCRQRTFALEGIIPIVLPSDGHTCEWALCLEILFESGSLTVVIGRNDEEREILRC